MKRGAWQKGSPADHPRNKQSESMKTVVVFLLYLVLQFALGANDILIRESDDDVSDSDKQARSKKVQMFNFAAQAAGAVVLDKSPPTAKGYHNLLNDDKDKYGISPCDEKKWVVIGLSEEVLITAVEVANYEKYSSTLRDFQLLASTAYPTEEWINLGTYTALPQLGVQHFNMTDLSGSHTRYLKVKFLTHYSDEALCTLSQIKVYGMTVIASFQQEVERSDAHVIDMRDMLETFNTEEEEASLLQNIQEAAQSVIEMKVEVESASAEIAGMENRNVGDTLEPSVSEASVIDNAESNKGITKIEQAGIEKSTELSSVSENVGVAASVGGADQQGEVTVSAIDDAAPPCSSISSSDRGETDSNAATTAEATAIATAAAATTTVAATEGNRPEPEGNAGVEYSSSEGAAVSAAATGGNAEAPVDFIGANGHEKETDVDLAPPIPAPLSAPAPTSAAEDGDAPAIEPVDATAASLSGSGSGSGSGYRSFHLADKVKQYIRDVVFPSPDSPPAAAAPEAEAEIEIEVETEPQAVLNSGEQAQAQATQASDLNLVSAIDSGSSDVTVSGTTPAGFAEDKGVDKGIDTAAAVERKPDTTLVDSDNAVTQDSAQLVLTSQPPHLQQQQMQSESSQNSPTSERAETGDTTTLPVIPAIDNVKAIAVPVLESAPINVTLLAEVASSLPNILVPSGALSIPGLLNTSSVLLMDGAVLANQSIAILPQLPLLVPPRMPIFVNSSPNIGTAGASNTSVNVNASASSLNTSALNCFENLSFAEFSRKMRAKLLQKSANSTGTGTNSTSNNNNSSTDSAAEAALATAAGVGAKDNNVFRALMQKIKALEMNNAIVEMYTIQMSECYKSVTKELLARPHTTPTASNMYSSYTAESVGYEHANLTIILSLIPHIVLHYNHAHSEGLTSTFGVLLRVFIEEHLVLLVGGLFLLLVLLCMGVMTLAVLLLRQGANKRG